MEIPLTSFLPLIFTQVVLEVFQVVFHLGASIPILVDYSLLHSWQVIQSRSVSSIKERFL